MSWRRETSGHCEYLVCSVRCRERQVLRYVFVPAGRSWSIKSRIALAALYPYWSVRGQTVPAQYTRSMVYTLIRRLAVNIHVDNGRRSILTARTHFYKTSVRLHPIISGVGVHLPRKFLFQGTRGGREHMQRLNGLARDWGPERARVQAYERHGQTHPRDFVSIAYREEQPRGSTGRRRPRSGKQWSQNSFLKGFRTKPTSTARPTLW